MHRARYHVNPDSLWISTTHLFSHLLINTSRLWQENWILKRQCIPVTVCMGIIHGYQCIYLEKKTYAAVCSLSVYLQPWCVFYLHHASLTCWLQGNCEGTVEWMLSGWTEKCRFISADATLIPIDGVDMYVCVSVCLPSCWQPFCELLNGKTRMAGKRSLTLLPVNPLSFFYYLPFSQKESNSKHAVS